MTDAVFDYLQGQLRPMHPALMEAFAAAGAAAVAALAPELEIAYGPHPRERFDIFRAAGAPRGTLLYFHAGYWQSRDKASFRCIAPALVAAGLHVAMVGYPLCPEVALAAVTEAARRALPAVAARLGGPLVIAGHSAGAHLAVELALTDWPAALRGRIAGIAGLSGVYDLQPLLDTPLNDKLRLDAAGARRHSPLYRLRGSLPPALFAVGAEETTAFRAQNAAMHAAWQAAGNPAELVEVPEADHFSLLQGFAPGAALLAAVLSLVPAGAAA
jgi:arylformamidase